jgi:hypothetical protein
MAVPAADPCASFVAKWLQREPEMRLASVFCPPGELARFQAWGGLLHELREAMFELSDPRVTSVKTAWWAEELIGLGQGRQRHPLSEALLGKAAPWSALGRALLEFDGSASRAADSQQAIGLLLPSAAAVVAVESALFATPSPGAAAPSLAVHWLLQRLPGGLAGDDLARLPMHLLARHGLSANELSSAKADPLLRDWASELLLRLPAPVPGAALIRRSRWRFDRARLQRLAAGKGFAEPPALATLWRAWRAGLDR